MIIPLALLAEAATKRTPKDYEWYKFGGKRSVKIPDGHKSYSMEIEPNECFGIRKRGKLIYLVDQNDYDIEFKLTSVQASSLLKRSKGWSGKVGRYTVSAGSFAAQDKPANTLTDKEPPKPSPRVTVNSSRKPNVDDPKIRAVMKSTKIPGIERAALLFSEEVLPGEWYYYYDLTLCLEKYKDSKGKLKPRWEVAVQNIFDTKTRLEAHCSMTNYKGANIPLLVVSDLD